MSNTTRSNRSQIVVCAAGTIALVLMAAPARLAAQATIAELTFPEPTTEANFACSIAGLGDVNGDGHGDFVTSEPHSMPGSSGVVLVYSGADFSVIHRWEGDASQGFFGACVDSAGDVDGDGVEDVVVGAPLANAAGAYAGLVRVYSGATGTLLYDIPGAAPYDYLGSTVAGVGDLDGDGAADFAGASQPLVGTVETPGSVRVFSGADGHAFVHIQGQLGVNLVGLNVRPAGDFNADGVPDVVLVTQAQGTQEVEHVVVLSGAWIVSGTLPDVLLDYSEGYGVMFLVDAAGDLDLDGWDDLVLGTPDVAVVPSPGSWCVISGRDHSLLFDGVGSDPAATLGLRVAGAGDLDRDDHPDVLVQEFKDAPWEAGRTFAFSGRDGSLLYTCQHESTELWGYGQGLAGVGDVNADGYLDWAVGGGGVLDLYSPVGIWSDLGHSLAGSAGAPTLSGTGLLLGGDAASVTLAGALPSQPILLVIGLSAVNLPFHGGVFVPNADLLLFDVTDAGGGCQWSSTWPAGVPAMSIYYQAWMEDPQAVEGWAASNGLRSQSP